jgi:hypothetical protein
MSSAVDLRILAETDVTQPLSAETIQTVLRRPPFVYVSGTFNTRDVGLVPTASGQPSELRPGFVYRSGGLNRLTDDGKSLLAQKLGIKKIFDLRSVEERTNSPDPDVPGAENVWLASAERDGSVNLADFVDGLGEKGYVRMYLDVLDLYQPNFTAVLEHIRDHPGEPFMFHCTGEFSPNGCLYGDNVPASADWYKPAETALGSCQAYC